MGLFTADEFCKKLIDIANNYRTLYVMGCFGAPMNDTNKKRYTTNHSYNKDPERKAMIMGASADTFGFDCVCLIKGVLWGWTGDTKAQYGGAKYASNGVPDVGTEEILKYCTGVSTDFNNIERGELVQMNGHVGVYVGDGNVVECSPAWKNKVQITKLTQRKWLKHGKMQWIEYGEVKPNEKPSETLKINDLIGITEDVDGYTTAADAIAHKQPPKVVYKKGNYYVYKKYVDSKGNTSYNISKEKYLPGAWVVLN